MKPIKDPYEREIWNLRISVNQECNFNCFFCHEEGLWNHHPTQRDYLTAKQIQTTVKILTDFGIREIKITGGEPLLRDDIIQIIRKISLIEEIEDLSMTSNGYFLAEYARKLKKAGLDRINVSLNSLDPDLFSDLTQTDPSTLEKVITGIKTAKNVGLSPVKLNFVALKDINVTEIPKVIDFARNNKLELHLIEFHAPKGKEDLYDRYYYSLDDLEEQLLSRADHVKIRKLQHRKKVIMPNGTGAELVRPRTNPEFCENCHRIRITARGGFKPCLMRTENHINFRPAFSSENPQKSIEKAFKKAIHRRTPYFSEKIDKAE